MPRSLCILSFLSTFTILFTGIILTVGVFRQQTLIDKPVISSGKSYKPPLVDRTTMERLGMYDEPEPIDSEWMNDLPRLARPGNSPLVVTALPDYKPPKYKFDSNVLADQRLCGHTDRPCQVVLAASIGEQESKAQAHLQQIAVIARLLNRTLILPNMYKSRLGVCYKNRFDLYYDVKSVEAFGVRVASYADFLEWCATRRTPPLAQIIETTTKQHATAPDSGWRRCLGKAAPRMTWTKNEAQVVVPDSKRFISSDRSIVDMIHQSALGTMPGYPNIHPLDVPQVYAFNWALRYPVFPETVDRYLDYSDRIVQFAERVLESAGPIAVVHWRMESVPPENLVACSRGLIETFGWISRQEDLADVRLAYLATDYPMEGGPIQHSGTFRDVKEGHHIAIDTFQKAFEPGAALEMFKVISYRNLTRSVPGTEDMLENDPGFFGIMDKVIASKADVFVRGSGQCARNRQVAVVSEVSTLIAAWYSSFTRQIIFARRSGSPRARNVEYIFKPYS